ncbi:hypothetical protein CRI93_04200 [Longimonas halophila]|uniref:DUF4359 domain-containing protein n=1 Tax=Longimonas halophila TaxID=1469170 RepID=A0A2H3NZ78_9BACT|nr:DUF4359 domain-containing protein [Longimonas halophila]PEN08323.1 hypothetical protein CRI93_04200 [Longimonas halophila]
MRISTLFLLVLVGLLVYTNPGIEAFEAHVEDEAATLIRNEVGSDSWLGDALGSVAGTALANRADEYTMRTNYFVASVYTIDIDGDEQPDLKWLGIADRFVQLEAKE